MLPERPTCNLPPRGWKCLQLAGHVGPCPTWPTGWRKVYYRLRGYC